MLWWLGWLLLAGKGLAEKSPVQPLHIGVLVHFRDVSKVQRQVSAIINSIDSRISAQPDIQVNITTHIQTMNDNSISSVLSLCQSVIETQPIHALIVSHPPDKPLEPPEALSYACGFYTIPIISISTQDPVYSEKALHPTFARTVQPDAHQAAVWADLLHDPALRYRQVVAVYPDNYNGRHFFHTLLTSFHQVFVTVGERICYKPGLTRPEALSLFSNLRSPLRVIALYGTEDDAQTLFDAAGQLGMLTADSGYFWLLSESAITYAPSGSVFVRLRGKDDFQRNMRMAISSLQSGLYHLLRKQGRLSPLQPLLAMPKCDSGVWPPGLQFFKSVRDQRLDESIQYDTRGNPTYSEYDILVKQGDREKLLGTWFQGSGDKDSKIDVDEAAVASTVWVGGRRGLPEGVIFDSNLTIVTVSDAPFVFIVPKTDRCDNATHHPCLQYNPILQSRKAMCCYGYCIQLLKSVSKSLNFSFTLNVAKDNKFGVSYVSTRDNSSTREWNGAVGELLRGEADVIFASLTIDNERSQVLEFTTPFKPQGLSIIVKRQKPSSSLSSFIEPFHYSLWILIFLSVHVVALILYLLDRFSPFAHSRAEIMQGGGAGGSSAAAAAEEEEALNLSSALWFAYGVLLNSGIGGTPRSFAARVLGMVWAGFAMIIVASYTANLAAYLVLERPESEITGINDARMRNPSENYKYGTVRDTAVESYFRRKVEMTNMYHFMQNYSHATQEEAILALKNEELHAFIWDSAQLDYETSRDCSLMTVGEIFHRSGLAVALAKDSPWTEKISLQILKMRETGEMEQLDRDWIIVNACESTDNKPTTLGIDSMAGIFITVGIGVLLGSVVIVLERIYFRQFGHWSNHQDEQIARAAFNKWKQHTEARHSLRQETSFGSPMCSSDVDGFPSMRVMPAATGGGSAAGTPMRATVAPATPSGVTAAASPRTAMRLNNLPMGARGGGFASLERNANRNVQFRPSCSTAYVDV